MRTCGTSKDIMLGLTAAILLLSFLARADAHGSLISPRSRNEIFFNGQWAATAGNGIGQRLGACQGPPPFGAPPGFCLPAGQPGVCGDPYQESPNPNINIATLTNYPIQATYTSGQTVTFSVKMQVNHGGRMTFRLCDRRTSLSQDCFNARTLLRADNNQPHWYILTGKWADPPTTMSMAYKLPTGFSCPNGCTIQWEYFTYNTCLEVCPAAQCGTDYANRFNRIIPVDQGPKPICYSSPQSFPPEIFKNCADVIITGGGPVPPPTPSPSPRPSPSPSPRPSPSPSPGPGPSDPCPGIAAGQARATCFCSKNRLGRYQDVFNGCSGGFWCYPGGASYISCGAGLRYDTAIGGICNWANQVACPNNVVTPASVTATVAASRARRRKGSRRSRAGEGSAASEQEVAATAAAAAPSEPALETSGMEVTAAASEHVSAESTNTEPAVHAPPVLEAGAVGSTVEGAVDPAADPVPSLNP